MGVVASMIPNDMPRLWGHRFITFLPLREADGVSIDRGNRKARVIIITEGLGNLRDKNFYTAEAVHSAVETFEGKQFFIDHPSEDEEETRPERSVRDLAGYFSECQVGSVPDLETGEKLVACFATLNFSHSTGGQLALDQVETALEYQRRYPTSKEVYAGISVNGGGVSHPGTIKGMAVNMVTEIQEAFSADIVTKPARGGRFLALMKEAARYAAARTQGMIRETGHHRTPRGGAGGNQQMATVVVKKKEAEPTKVVAAQRRESVVSLLTEVKALKREVRESVKSKKCIGTVKEVATEKLKTAAAKYTKVAAVANEAGDDLKDLLIDIQQDIGELSKMLGTGGGAEVPGDEEAGDDAGMGAGDDEMPDLGAMDEEPDAEAAEGEEEGERAAEGEGEGEEEASAAEGEDEEEALTDETEGEGEPRTSNMKFSCAKCGEVNEVAPPKGFKLARADAGGMMSEADALQATVSRLQRTLEAKEGRFVATNHKMSTVLKENMKLKAQVIALNRLNEAKRLLREAKIPPDILPAKDLVMLYEPEQWGAAIRQATRMLARESKLLSRGGQRPKDGGAGSEGDERVPRDSTKVFEESYKAS